MYRIVVTLLTISLIFFACKEVPVYINLDDSVSEDTSYVANIETAQDKKYLIEELSGAQCVNCPQGIAKLNEMNASGEFAGKLIIASIHVGTFTEPIPGKSKQNFVVSGAEQLLSVVLGSDPGKPCAAFERLEIKPNESLLLPRYTSWSSFMSNARDSSDTKSPLNIDIATFVGDVDNEYKIEVKVAYTQEMVGNQSLNIYLTEDKIIDAMLTPNGIKEDYEFNHTFRGFVTPPTGKIILPDITTKEAGRVYIYRVTVKKDPTHEQQKYWNPENMNVIAFVSSSAGGTKRVYQVAETHLIQ